MEYKNVQYVEVNKNLKYYLYVPENVNPNTEIFFYAQGSGIEGGKKFVADYLEKNGSNSIVVVPSMEGGYSALDWEKNSVNIAETLQKQYNLNNKNIVSSGWSGGGWGAFKTTIENIKRNPDIEPQILFTLDDVSPTILNDKNHPTDSRYVVMNNGGREALRQNDTIIFMFQANTKGKYYSKKEAAAFDFAQAGANVVRVRIESCGGHEGIFQNFFKKGLVEYSNGLVALPNEKYIYETPVYDQTTGKYKWIQIDYENIKTKENLYNYFGLESKRIAKKNETFFSKLFDFLGEKTSILKSFSSKNHQLSTNLNEVEQVCNYLRNDVCMQLDEMTNAVNNAYQAVADYAASSPYPVGIPAGFDKTEAIRTLKKAIEVCNDSAEKVYNVSDIINRYSNGQWSLTSGTLTKINDFIGFVASPNKTSTENNNDDNNERFKFF